MEGSRAMSRSFSRRLRQRKASISPSFRRVKRLRLLRPCRRWTIPPNLSRTRRCGMEAFVAAALVIIGLVVGAVAAWRLRGREIGAERERATRAEANCTALADALQEEKVACATAEATIAAERQAHQDKVAELTSLRGDIETKLQALAAEALRGNEASFLRLAEQAFEKHKEAAANLLTQKQQAIAALLAPMATSLEAYRQGLGGFENAWR